jgi:probable HAF family extracellular repeat protein
VARAYAASADGEVVVGSADGIGAFRWTEASGMMGLGDLPGDPTYGVPLGVSADGGTVVGYSFSANSPQEAFLWTQASGMILLGDLDGGAFYSWAEGISADGIWAVGAGRSAAGSEAMRWSDATGMLPLGILPGTAWSAAIDVSGDGSIIVGTSDEVAFLWDEAHGMRDLKQVLQQDFALDLTGWSLTRARGVSLDGLTIVGEGLNPQGRTEGWVAVIPEPSTAALLAVGLVVLGRWRRGA